MMGGTLTVSLIDFLLCYTDAGWHTVCCDWCGLLRYTDAGWHTVCCECGVDCSVILMLDDMLCTVTAVWTAPLYCCWMAHCVL